MTYPFLSGSENLWSNALNFLVEVPENDIDFAPSLCTLSMLAVLLLVHT